MKKIIIAQDYSEYYKIEVIENPGSYIIEELEGEVVKNYETYQNSEDMLNRFIDIYNSYRLVDRLTMKIVQDDFGIGFSLKRV